MIIMSNFQRKKKHIKSKIPENISIGLGGVDYWNWKKIEDFTFFRGTLKILILRLLKMHLKNFSTTTKRKDMENITFKQIEPNIGGGK